MKLVSLLYCLQTRFLIEGYCNMTATLRQYRAYDQYQEFFATWPAKLGYEKWCLFRADASFPS